MIPGEWEPQFIEDARWLDSIYRSEFFLFFELIAKSVQYLESESVECMDGYFIGILSYDFDEALAHIFRSIVCECET